MKIFRLALALIACLGVGHASIIFQIGNHPQADELNVLLSSGATGTLVTGTPNGHPEFTVNFSSTQTLEEPSSGQARVSGSPEGTALTFLNIALASGTYGDLIMNPFQGSGDATVTVHSVDSLGNPEADSVFVYALGNGQNFLTITTAGGERIVSTDISAPGGFHDLRQPRISGLGDEQLPGIPEPGTSALLGIGFVGLAALLRKRPISVIASQFRS